MYRPELVTPPSTTPMTVAEAKANLRVDGSDEDTLIGVLVQAATDHLDGYSGILGRCLVTQTWRQDYDYFGQVLRLPLLADAIGSVVYVDDIGGSNTVTSSNYELMHDDAGSYLRFIDDYPFPSGLAERRALRVTFTAGFGDAEDVPSAIKYAMHLLIGHWYENREASTVGSTASPLPIGAMALIEPYRHVGV